MSGKQRIIDAFSSASATYEQAATAQKVIAGRLADKVMGLSLPASPRVLEIGCGTGFLSRSLLERIKGGEWILSDISPAMLARCQENIHDSRIQWRVMDGEYPDLSPNSIDLIVSSLAVQWFSDLEPALERLKALLKPQGHLLFVTLGSDSFKEWRIAHQALQLPCSLRTFSSHLPACVDQTEERMTFSQKDALTFARNFKEIGAHTPTSGSRALTPAQFRALARLLGNNFCVTYHLLYGHATKSR